MWRGCRGQLDRLEAAVAPCVALAHPPRLLSGAGTGRQGWVQCAVLLVAALRTSPPLGRGGQTNPSIRHAATTMRRAPLLATLCRQFGSGLEAACSQSCAAAAVRRQPVGLLPAAARWFASQPAAAGGAAAAAAGGAVAAEAAAPTGLRLVKRTWKNYKKLSKFRLSMLVVATSSAGYVAGSKEKIDWAGLGWTSLGTFMASASANALNQVYEVRCAGGLGWEAGGVLCPRETAG